MNHAKLQLLVSSYLDDETSDDEKAIVISHLEQCTECKDFVRYTMQMKEIIRLEKDVKLSDYFAVRVSHSVKKQSNEVENWLGIEPLARNTFLALTIIVLIVFVFAGIDNSNYSIIDEQLLLGGNGDSASTRVLIQKEELSKNDLLYAVLTK